jgi:biotin carboxylase
MDSRGLGSRHDVFIDPDPSWMPTMRRARQRGHYISAICSPRYARAYPEALALAHSAAVVNTSSQGSLTKELMRLERRDHVAAVLVHRDAIIAKVAAACEASGIHFTSRESLGIALSKVSTRLVLEQRGLSSVRYEAAHTLADVRNAALHIGFPCVLKPAWGHGSLLAFRLRDLAQLRTVQKKIRAWATDTIRADRWLLSQGFVCEEWIEGPIVSVELSVVRGIIRPITVALGTAYAENPCGGLGNIIPFDWQPTVARRCVEYAKRVCQAIGFDLCVCDLEMKWTKSGPVLLEANPRKMGGQMPLALELATGLDFNDIMLDTYANRPPTLRTKKGRMVTVIRKLIPTRPGRIRGEPSRPWLSSFRPSTGTIVRLCNDALHAGARVRRHQVVGRVLAVCGEPQEGFRQAKRAVHCLEAETGLQFATGKLPVVYPGGRHANVKEKGVVMTTPAPSPAPSPSPSPTPPPHATKRRTASLRKAKTNKARRATTARKGSKGKRAGKRQKTTKRKR